MATSTGTGRWHGMGRSGAAFAVCLAGSLCVIAYGLISESGLTLEMLVGCLAAMGIVAGILAPSVRGLLAAVAGGWAGLLGYGAVYMATHADEAEAGFYQGTFMVIVTVLVPISIGPGVLAGATTARGLAAARRKLASGG